jgi:hypothetical protein
MAAFPFALATSPVASRARGRPLFWLGIFVSLLALALPVVQYSQKILWIPWYLPVLGTLGALLLLGAAVSRPSVVRVIFFGLLAALAAFEWYFLLFASLVPAYEGPARAGQPFPAFQTTLADGRSFTEKDLQTGIPTVMAFFRGRW